MKNFVCKVIVITGGATGIGFAFAKAFAAEGAKIILAGRREERLQEAVSKLKKLGKEAIYKVTDVTQPEQVEELADFAWDWRGHVDVLINNAGIMIPHAPVLDMPIKNIEQIFSANFFSIIIGSQVFGRRLIEQETPAAIYNIGSENSLFHGTPFNGAYVATKHSVFALTESLYEELPDYIDVSLICPGFVISELGPKESMQFGMPADQFVDMAMPQLKANEFLVVSHAYNKVLIDRRYSMIDSAYKKYAPRYDGDQQYDVRTVVKPILEKQFKLELHELK